MSKREYERGTLGWWMDDRRGDLRLTWDEVANRAGVSPETLRRNASNPSGMRSTTKKGIDDALDWERGSIDAILTGGEPTTIDQSESEPSFDDKLDALHAELSESLKRAQDAQAEIDALLKETRRTS